MRAFKSLSRVYTRAACCPATCCLLPAICCLYLGNIPFYSATDGQQTGNNFVAGNMLLVAGNMLLKVTCCRQQATCCPGVNAALANTCSVGGGASGPTPHASRLPTIQLHCDLSYRCWLALIHITRLHVV